MKYLFLVGVFSLSLMSGCVEETTQKILTCKYEGVANVKFVYVFDTADFDKENKVETYEVWVQPNEERTKVITKTTDTEVIPYEVTPTSLRFSVTSMVPSPQHLMRL